MNYAEIEQLFHQELEANWTATPIVYDNASAPNTEQPWVRFVIIPTFTETGSIGQNPRTIREGFATMQVFTKPDTGSRKALEIADAALELLQYREFGNTLFVYSGNAERIGDDGFGWFQVNVLLEFVAT